MKIELNNDFSVIVEKGNILGIKDKIALRVGSDWSGMEVGINAQQAREVATELNRLADEVEEKFYIKVINSSSGYLNLSDDGTISLNNCEEIRTLKTQFTQAEIDANPDLKKFDSAVFKVRVVSE